MKKRKVQEESNDENDKKEEQGFDKDLSRHGTKDLPCKVSE